MVYLIPCSGSKQKPTNNHRSDLKSLSFTDSLHEARIYLIEKNEIDLDWNNTLPAWQLYSGKRSKIYPKITPVNWENERTDVRILSALFGLVKHTDLLPYYDFKMSQKIKDTNLNVKRYWYNLNLLRKLVNKDYVDLLSQNYRYAVYGNEISSATVPDIIFTERYGAQKGIWINEQLTNTL